MRKGNEPMADAVHALMTGEPEQGNEEVRRRKPDEQGDEQGDEQAAPRSQPDDPGEQGADEGTDAQGKPEPIQLASIDDVAHELGLSRAELNGIEVQVGPDKMTLGELKAKMGEFRQLERRGVELDDAKTSLELERVDHHRRVNAIVSAFPPGSIPPSVLRHVENQHAETMARESKALTTARPEWAETQYATAAREKMLATAAKYGFTKADMASILDHRQILLLQDFAALQDRMAKAKTDARLVPANPDARIGADTAAASFSPRKSRGGSVRQDDRTAAVYQVMNRRR